ncbi:hypothetical protein [Bacillus suaedae]|uniref:Uncharacterized protein n=1 Tax=Halalkalibacter suaedae TaxID=2822140 RepID=A0A940WRQ2_9BACI|nr:hypothetical protein [Bacillus suaedae]MBP3950573.1 hypothetical protein [Bacillus suaedae]
MDGVFLYWFGWGFWIIITFLWTKSSKRFWSAFAILLLLCLFPITITISERTFHIVFLLFLLFIYYQIGQFKKRQKYFSFPISTIGIAAFYAGFQFILIFDPVVQIIDSRWMIGSVSAMLAYLMSNTFKTRLILGIVGVMHGELLVKFNENFFDTSSAIGSAYFFDVLAIICSIYGVGWLLRMLSITLSKMASSQLKWRNGRQYSGNQIK